MLARRGGSEKRSENRTKYKGCVFITVYIHKRKLQESKLDQRGHAVMMTTRTHTHTVIATEERKDMELVLPSGGYLWPFGTVVGDDASQTAQRRKWSKQCVWMCLCVPVCICVYTGVWRHIGQSQRWSQIVWANEKKIWLGWQGLMFTHFVPCQYKFMLAAMCNCLSVSVYVLWCIWVYSRVAMQTED